MDIQVKKSSIKNIGVISIITILVILSALLIFNKPSVDNNSTGNATIEGNNQIINMTAKATGYTPNIITAKANTATTLHVDSTNNFGCTSSMRIPSLGISKVLNNGSTDIALGSQAPGTTIDGTCSMGMYNFKINFS